MSKTYINATCKVGQSEPCGRDAVWSIAVTGVAETAWATDLRGGGVVALCEFHATTPVSKWDATPAEGPGYCGKGPCCLLDGHEGRCER